MQEKTALSKNCRAVRTCFGKNYEVFLDARDLIRCLNDDSERALLPESIGGIPGTKKEKEALAAGLTVTARKIEKLVKLSQQNVAAKN